MLDYMKGDVNLNRLLMGGIEGEHYSLDSEGNRTALDAADGYGWNNWAWAINRQDEPDEAGLDEREIAINEHNEEMEYIPQQTGFTFDSSSVQTEFTVVQSIVDEYKMAFALGIYGDDTASTFESFKSQLEDAGIQKVLDEFVSQYNDYMSTK